jgi:hypothetical protein
MYLSPSKKRAVPHGYNTEGQRNMTVVDLARCLALAAVFGAGMAGCGGGGGGGGGGGAGVAVTSPPAAVPAGPSTGSGNGQGDTPVLDPNFTTIDLSISKITPASLQQTFYEGANLDPLLFVGTATGDLNLLNGKTLYIVIEDGDQLFEANAQATVHTSGGVTGVAVGPSFRKTIKPGSYAGSLNIYACLDARCSVRFKDAPFKLPYDVKIKAASSFADTGSSAIDVRVPFSTTPRTVSLPLTPAEGTPASNLSLSAGSIVDFVPELSLAKAVVTHGANGQATLDVTIPPLTNGGRYKLGWELITPNINPPRKVLTVNLNVDPDPALPYAFGVRDLLSVVTPVTDFQTTKQISQPATPWPAELLVSTGSGTLTLENYSFVDALGNPAANPPNFTYSMLRVFNSRTDDIYPSSRLGWGWTTSVYFDACNTNLTACIAPGVYHVRLHYRHQVDGGSQPVHFPVKLTVLP